MKERPILFSGEMVRAILEGRKTQTRRVIKPGLWLEMDGEILPDGSGGYGWEPTWKGKWLSPAQCPYGRPGDLLWVRETWRYSSCSGYTPANGPARYQATLEYKSTYDNPINFQRLGKTVELPEMHYGGNLRKDGDVAWKPSIHMPRWASRLTLRITDVRVNQLQEMSDEDCYDEGTIEWANVQDLRHEDGTPAKYPSVRHAFRALWDSINAKRGYSWESNPWVWVVEFKRVSNG